MCVLAALQAGAGLVSGAVPESLVPAFAARAPEAIWIGLPETPDGGLALEGVRLLHEAAGRVDAVVIGPGLGRERETLALAREIVARSSRPLVLDADALHPEVVGAGSAPRVLTPHGGESARLGTAIPGGAVVVRKGPLTRIEVAAVGDGARGPAWHSFFGGPVLSRGGSGDILAGLIGTLLAQTPGDPRGAAVRGVVWQGLAADALARERGAAAVRSTQLLDFLAPALRACGT
jgi:NAD(P)H-hydrate epimerase